MKLAKNRLSKIKPYKPGKPIEEVERELGQKNVIKLASNENALPPSDRVISAISKAAKTLNRYPDSDCYYLKAALAEKFRRSPDNFIIGNGSDEIITFAVRAFLDRGEEAVIAKPTFLMYDIAAKIAGGAIRHVPLKNYRYDLGAMKDAVTKKTRLVFIANPDNPTGTYVTKGEVDDFFSGLRKDVIVFFDEAYYEFAKNLDDYPDSLEILKEKKDNIIITRSFSKIHSLAGLRVGYGIAQRRLVECMNKVRDPFNVNSLAQKAAMAALDDEGFVLKTKRMVEEGKDYLYEEFERMGIEYVPSATNFILFKAKDAPGVYKKLLRRGVIIREMTSWGLKGFLRVTIGTMRENRRFVETLKEIVDNRKT